MSIYDDPVPGALSGNPAAIGTHSRRYRTTASDLREAAARLLELANDNVIISDAIDEVRNSAREVRGHVVKIADRYEGAANTYDAYKSDLEDAQSRAEGARQRIISNNSQARWWRARQDRLVDEARANPTDPEIAADLTEANAKVRGFDSEFVNASSVYNSAASDKEAAALAAIGALNDVADQSGLDDSGWDHLGAFFEGVYEWCQEYLAPVLEIIRQIAELVKAIVDVLALIVGILAIFLPFLAPLAAALSLVSLALSALVLICSLLLFALGKESLGRVLSDAIGFATSIITSKMGGNFFGSGGKLEGLTNVFKPSAWGNATTGMAAKVTTDLFMDGAGKTALNYASDIALKVIKPETLTIKLGSSLIADQMKYGLDFQVDLFPENATGTWSEGGSVWDYTPQEQRESATNNIVKTLTGGLAGNITKIENFSLAAA